MALTRHYTFVDYATQGYTAVVAGLILCFHQGRVPGWGWLLLAHATVLILVHLLIGSHAARPRHAILEFIRFMYPVLLYTGFYRETGSLNMMFVPGYVDHVVIRAEQALFGFQPSLAFMERMPQRWLSELLYAAYFSYYLMISGVGIALFLRNRAQCYHYVAVVSFVFYVLYLTYIFVPVMGPRAFFREIDGYTLPEELQALAAHPYFPEGLQHGFFFRIMKFIYAHFEAPGAAFPSSHVVVAIATAYFTWRYLPRLRVVHPVLVMLLCAGTVYGRYHYIVDVIAGALAALTLIPLGDWLHRRFPPAATLIRGNPGDAPPLKA